MTTNTHGAEAWLMKKRTYTVRFVTPAFLGNANQDGQWRTPPFKHLLREWWRVAWALENDPAKWEEMRNVEGRLLGHAWLKDDRNERGQKVSARRSQVRMRLDPWADGTMEKMPSTKPVGDGRNAVASHLYLGYGPVNSAAELEMSHPLDPDRDQASFTLAWPEMWPGAEFIELALVFIHAYGTVGGRSRNGWGSVAFHPSPLEQVDGKATPPLRDWRECLRQQWAHAIGSDGKGPLIWRTETRRDWKAVIEELAAIRKRVNSLAKRHGQREVLNQPVAGRCKRVPSNLRFKVREDGNGGCFGVVFHMPFLPPGVDAKAAVRTWPQVHDFLDDHDVLQRSPS